MLLVPVAWAGGRVWALPFLSVLAPSERYAAERAKHHKKTTDWARQMLLLVRRWWPEREIVAVADSAYASLRLLASCRRFLPKPVTFITRFYAWTPRSTILLHRAEPDSWADRA